MNFRISKISSLMWSPLFWTLSICLIGAVVGEDEVHCGCHIPTACINGIGGTMAQVLNTLEEGLGKFSFIINIVFGLLLRTLPMETQNRIIAEGRMNPVELALEGLAMTGTRVGCFDAVDAFIDSINALIETVTGRSLSAEMKYGVRQPQMRGIWTTITDIFKTAGIPLPEECKCDCGCRGGGGLMGMLGRKQEYIIV